MDSTFKYIAIIINISILVCAIFVEFKSVLDVITLNYYICGKSIMLFSS